MAKNRVTPDKPAKQKSNFFLKPQQKFKSRLETGHKKKTTNAKFQTNVQYSTEDQRFKPSISGSDAFFVKSTNSTELSKTTEKPPGKATAVVKRDKKPFDKKKFRLQKYSKKYKLEQWEEKRKKAILHGYYRTLKTEEPKLDVNLIYEQHKDDEDDDDDDVDGKANVANENNLNASINDVKNSREEPLAPPKNSREKKGRAFKKAHLEFQRIKEQKQKKREMVKRKEEKKEALQAYKKKKVEKFKKLSRKTKRGQPIMKERIEMLLEKIQSSIK